MLELPFPISPFTVQHPIKITKRYHVERLVAITNSWIYQKV
jgi:hypothetical protein